jgi:hypothetical protein
MAYLGGAFLLLIAMTIAANLHPEGPALVILLFWATPALFWGLLMLMGRNERGAAARRFGGLMLLALGVALMVVFFRLL